MNFESINLKKVWDNIDEILENNTSDKSLVNDKIDIEVKKENKFNSDFTGKKKLNVKS